MYTSVKNEHWSDPKPIHLIYLAYIMYKLIKASERQKKSPQDIYFLRTEMIPLIDKINDFTSLGLIQALVKRIIPFFDEL